MTLSFVVPKGTDLPILVHVPSVHTRKHSPDADSGTVVPLLAMKRTREALHQSARHTRNVDAAGGDGDGNGNGMWAQQFPVPASGLQARPGTGSSSGGGSRRGLAGSASLPMLKEGETGTRCAGQFCGCRVERVGTGVFAVRRPHSQFTSVRYTADVLGGVRDGALLKLTRNGIFDMLRDASCMLLFECGLPSSGSFLCFSFLLFLCQVEQRRV